MANQPPEGIHPGKERDRSWLGIVAIAFLAAASIWLIGKADDSKPQNWNEDQLTYLPSGKMLKPMMMDLDEAAGDLLWVNSMIYFADAYLTHRSYQWLGHMLDVVTSLNPKLYAAYEFGGVVLTKEKAQLPKTLKLLDRGVEQFPKDWKLRVFACMAQLTLDSNFTKAAAYLEPVSLDKEVPDHIRTLCATLLNRGGGTHVALAFLVDRWLRSENAINRELFADKILKLYEGPGDGDPARKETLIRILRQIAAQPAAEMVGLGLINEYLSGEVSPRSRAMLDGLRK